MNDNSQEPRRLDPSAVTDAVHHMSGEEGKAKIRLSALVSAIFKKHTEEEKEQVLTAGLAGHVPDERSMVPQWPRPWLYSRVFLWIFALAWFTYGLLYLTYNLYVTATLLLLAVSMFPLTMLFFFYECNIPRNISLTDSFIMLFVGGIISLLLSVVLGLLLPAELFTNTWYGAIVTGITEELSMCLLIFWFIRRHKAKHLLTGLLIGACIGAGFCILEKVGFLFNLSAESVYSEGGVYLNYFRPQLLSCWFLSFGSHTTWGALTAAGIIAAKQDRSVTSEILKSTYFLRFALLALAFQILWRFPWPFDLDRIYTFVHLPVAVIGFALLIFQISAGLRQINRFRDQAWEKAAETMALDDDE
ncbi:MAG: PrsW family intramembrane metalloprotease [Lachnospiraceae bacterium]|nr:PrsW family intramembrane metalloprotease [Lachnospiraceae bacterium]